MLTPPPQNQFFGGGFWVGGGGVTIYKHINTYRYTKTKCILCNYHTWIVCSPSRVVWDRNLDQIEVMGSFPSLPTLWLCWCCFEMFNVFYFEASHHRFTKQASFVWICLGTFHYCKSLHLITECDLFGFQLPPPPKLWASPLLKALLRNQATLPKNRQMDSHLSTENGRRSSVFPTHFEKIILTCLSEGHFPSKLTWRHKMLGTEGDNVKKSAKS